MTFPRPRPADIAEFYLPYLAQVPEGTDPRVMLHDQLEQFAVMLAAVPAEREGYRYQPGKWSVREVVGHMTDGERLFDARILSMLRGDTTPMPGFEQDDYVAAGRFESRSLLDLTAEWVAVRRSSCLLADTADEASWDNRGTANGVTFSARAKLYLLAGHSAHHMLVLRERYGLG